MDRKAIHEYFCQAGVEIAYLFGSLAQERAHTDSDCDLALLMAEPWDSKEGLILMARLQRDLQPLCGRTVDLSFLNSAPALFRFEVIRNGEVLFSRDELARIEWEKRTRDDYEDFVHFQSFYIHTLKEKLAS